MTENDNQRPIPVYIEGPVESGGAPSPALIPADTGLAVALARAEIDTAIATARAFPRNIGRAIQDMTAMATLTPAVAEDCIYSLPRGGKQIRGPSIRFAEIIRAAWGNSRDAARVVHIDRIDRVAECEAVYHDLQTNISTTATVRRTIEIKRGKHTIDLDMIQLAGAAGMSIARRNAILGGIPRPIWEPVVEQIERVIRGDEKTLGERRERAVAYFAKAGIGAEQLLKALGKPSIEEIGLDDLVTMTGWRTAITQGDSTLDELFPEERKPGPKKDLGEKLDALADASPSRPEGDAGEAALATPGEAASPTSAGAPSNAPAQPQKADDVTPPSAPQAATMPAGAHDRARPSHAPAKGATPAGGPPKGGDKASERRAALMAIGDQKAKRGRDALMEWLDNLPGDDAALLTPAMEKRWTEIVE